MKTFGVGTKLFPVYFVLSIRVFTIEKIRGGIGLARLEWSRNIIALKVEGGVEEVLKF